MNIITKGSIGPRGRACLCKAPQRVSLRSIIIICFSAMAFSVLSSSSALCCPPVSPPPRACFPQPLCSSFLPSGLHSSSSSVFVRDGSELLARKVSKLGKSKQPGRLAVQALFGLGVPELVVIAGVAAIIFGPKKLPEIGKSLGKTVKSFQQAAKEFETEVKQGGDSVSTEASKPDGPAVTSPADTEKENSQV